MKHTTIYFSLFLLYSNFSFSEICRFDDNRIEEFETKVGRLTLSTQDKKSKRCTAALIGNGCIVTSASCSKLDTIEFNVPQSINNTPQDSKDSDRYSIDNNSWKLAQDKYKQKNWAVARLKKNTITGKHADEVQGFFSIQRRNLLEETQIKIVQFSKTDPTRFHVIGGYVGENAQGRILNYAQSVGHGEVKKLKKFFFKYRGFFEHNVDTDHGATGAPIVNNSTGELIGVQTHGGCRPVGPRRSHRGQRNPGDKWLNGANSVFGDKDFAKAINSCLKL